MSVLSKMMRMAGRDPDGKARALQTDEKGNLKTQLTGSYVRHSSEGEPSEGREGDELIYWDTKQFFLHDGTQWRELSNNE